MSGRNKLLCPSYGVCVRSGTRSSSQHLHLCHFLLRRRREIKRPVKGSKTLSWPRPLGRGSESNSSPQLAPKQNCVHNPALFWVVSFFFHRSLSFPAQLVPYCTSRGLLPLFFFVIKTYTPIACRSVLLAKAMHPGLLLFAAVSIVLSAFLSCNWFNWNTTYYSRNIRNSATSAEFGHIAQSTTKSSCTLLAVRTRQITNIYYPLLGYKDTNNDHSLL